MYHDRRPCTALFATPKSGLRFVVWLLFVEGRLADTAPLIVDGPFVSGKVITGELLVLHPQSCPTSC